MADGVSPVTGSNLALFAQLQAARGGAMENQARALQAKSQTLSQAAKSASTSQGRAADEAKLKKACQDFESIFWNFILQAMRQSSPKSEFLDSGPEHEIFTSMQDEEFSKSFASTGGLGISRMLFEQLKKTL
jgi:flagellar protein FlgJ